MPGRGCFDDIPGDGIVVSPSPPIVETLDWSYEQAVGCLLWMSEMMRPDIASAVRAVAVHAHIPAARHWKAMRR